MNASVLTIGAGGVVLFGAISAATAEVTFSDVEVGGSLASGSTWVSENSAIDFSFPDATVGDFSATDSGDIVITFHAHSTEAGIGASSVLVSVLGALSGTGSIWFNETVVDMNTGFTIADFSTTYDSFEELPGVEDIDFSAVSDHIFVTKTFRLSAVNGRSFDFANVSLVEQTFREDVIPTPAAGIFLGASSLLLARRRRLG